MARLPIRVLKFGSSVLANDASLSLAVHEVYRELRVGRRVVAVVSAFGRTTDRLIARAARIRADGEPAELALLLSTGETAASALFALALQAKGLEARALEPAEIDLALRGPRLDGEPVAVDLAALERALDSHSAVVVPGFFGRGDDDRVALSGRGGSDLSALFLAHELGASLRLVKDVDGVFDRDPKLDGARRFERVSFDDALELGGGVVQAKTLERAREFDFEFEVGAPDSREPTIVGSSPSTFATPRERERRLRVALLGAGVVGSAVWRALGELERRFEVVHVLVRDLAKPRDARIPRSRLTDDPNIALAGELDLAIELTGDASAAESWLANALERGVDVVTANKALVARAGLRLAAIAERFGARLATSAAVGGAVPMLEFTEAIGRTDPIESLEAVLNGTTQFVLERLRRGATWSDALAEARTLGLCEADPWRDLSGIDAAEKLELLARVAFGADSKLEWRERCGIAHLEAREVAKSTRRLALVASARRTSDGIAARLAPRELAPNEPLRRANEMHVALVLRTSSGAQYAIGGAGAGGIATAESVIGDVLALARERNPSRRSLALADRGAA